MMFLFNFIIYTVLLIIFILIDIRFYYKREKSKIYEINIARELKSIEKDIKDLLN